MSEVSWNWKKITYEDGSLIVTTEVDPWGTHTTNQEFKNRHIENAVNILKFINDSSIGTVGELVELIRRYDECGWELDKAIAHLGKKV